MTKKKELESLIENYIEKNIQVFHRNRLESLNKLKLTTILRRKNPYLFRAKNLINANDFIKSITDAHISSSEETLFGDWLEELAIFVCHEVKQGVKSSTEGIDLEFTENSIRYLVSIKSGPNWGNSSQIKKMISNFNTARKVLRTSNRVNSPIEFVNGCCYGKDNKPIKKENYTKLCGQEFWYFISGEQELYKKIIVPLGKNAKKSNDEFNESYEAKINLFVAEFIKDFCTIDGSIDWNNLLEFVSKKA
jgi:hypothetical protein